MTQIFTIKVSDIPKIDSLINRINKKAKTHGLSGVSIKVLMDTKRAKKFTTVVSDIDPFLDDSVVLPVVDVSVEGNLPIVKGYSFVASIHTIGDSNIIFGGLNHDLSKFRNGGLSCDHCGTKRNRKKTIIVKGPDGNLFQVGRSCVNDFLGNKFESDLHQLESSFIKIRDLEVDENEEPKAGEVGFPIEFFLSLTASVINKHGWVSSSSAFNGGGTPTKNIVLGLLGDKKSKIDITDADVRVAKDSLEWILNETPDSDFIHNIQTIAKHGFVGWKTAGFACSIIKAHENHIKSTKRVSDFSNSEFVSKVGDKIVSNVKVVSKKTFDGRFGASSAITFVTPDGNVLTTFTSGALATIEKGEEIKIKGTVKAHNIFRDTKQTVLTRVSASY